MTAQAPNGSSWYYLGKHWVVKSQTIHDGEPAVVLRMRKGSSNGFAKVTHTHTIRALDKYGIRQDEGRGGNSPPPGTIN